MQCKAVLQRILVTQQISNTVVVGTVITELGERKLPGARFPRNLDREQSIRGYSRDFFRIEGRDSVHGPLLTWHAGSRRSTDHPQSHNTIRKVKHLWQFLQPYVHEHRGPIARLYCSMRYLGLLLRSRRWCPVIGR
jgi:hypothetical protein